MLRLTKIKLVENNELDDSFIETYVQAQYLYSQLLRERNCQIFCVNRSFS